MLLAKEESLPKKKKKKKSAIWQILTKLLENLNI